MRGVVVRSAAAVGDGWHVGVVTVLAEETRAILDVFGIAVSRRFHTGRMAVPGGVTYLVVAPPAGTGGVTDALAARCARYDPPVVVLVSGGGRDVPRAGGQEPVDGLASGGSCDVPRASRQDPAERLAFGGGRDAAPAGAREPVERLVPAGGSDVALAGGREPVEGAVGTFFAAAGEPASLPGFGGAAPFRVFRGIADDEVARFAAGATTRRGKPLAWAVIRGGTADRNAAQTLRYLIPYLRPRLDR